MERKLWPASDYHHLRQFDRTDGGHSGFRYSLRRRCERSGCESRAGGGISASEVFTITGSLPSDVSFVAPNGNDNNLGTIAAPYLTIQKCATAVSNGSTCAIRAGTYRETVTPNSGTTITSYDGEPVTVDGSDPVTGWTLYKGSIYQANVALSTGDTNQVFVGNQMMTEARWPNSNDLFHGNWATMQAGTTTTQVVDPNLPNINWTGATISQWSGSDPWALQTGVVTASSQGTIQFSGIATGYCPLICPTAGGYYFLSNFLGALDTQQEWYYDPTAGVLYFWAPGNAESEHSKRSRKNPPIRFRPEWAIERHHRIYQPLRQHYKHQ